MESWYEIHWARANRADEIVGMRPGAARYATRAEAELAARAITPPRADVVSLVVEVRPS